MIIAQFYNSWNLLFSLYIRAIRVRRHSSDPWRATTTGARIKWKQSVADQPTIEASSRNKPQFILRGAWVEGMGIGLLTIVSRVTSVQERRDTADYEQRSLDEWTKGEFLRRILCGVQHDSVSHPSFANIIGGFLGNLWIKIKFVR